jgi:hypothetical protein
VCARKCVQGHELREQATVHTQTRRIHDWGSSGRRFKSCQPDGCQPDGVVKHDIGMARTYVSWGPFARVPLGAVVGW